MNKNNLSQRDWDLIEDDQMDATASEIRARRIEAQNRLTENDWEFLQETCPETTQILLAGVSQSSLLLLDKLIEEDEQALELWLQDRANYRFGEAAWRRDPDPRRMQEIRDKLTAS